VSQKTKPKTPKTTLSSSAMMNLDLEQFFFDAVRERSLYALLDGLGSACSCRAEQRRLSLADDTAPAIRVLYEDEAEFFEDAAEQIFDVLAVLDDQWKDRAPAAAHGDIGRTWLGLGLRGMITKLDELHSRAASNSART